MASQNKARSKSKLDYQNLESRLLLSADLPYGVSPAEVEKFENLPFNSNWSTKTEGPKEGPTEDGSHEANILTFVLDFKESGQGTTSDIFGYQTTSFSPTSYGFSSGDFDTIANAILDEVNDDYYDELLGTVANTGSQDLRVDFVIGDIGTPPVGATEYYYIQIGTGVGSTPLGVAGGSVVRNSLGNGPNSGIQVGDVVGSVFTDAIQSLSGLSPSNALSSGNLGYTTFAIGGTLSHEIGHTVSLSHINKAGSVQPTSGRSPIMGTGAIDLPNQDRITDREFSLFGFDGQNGNAQRMHIQQLANAIGLHDVNTTDGDDQISEALSTSIGSSVFDDIATVEDVDMWEVFATAGQTFYADVDIAGQDLDSYLRLFDASGNQLGFSDDDVGPGSEPFNLESYLEYTPTTDGFYYLGVSAFNNSTYNPVTGDGDSNGMSTGAYELTINVLAVECDESIHVTPVNFGIAVTDNATGTGYMMYTAESVHTRFGDTNAFNADHLIAVRLNGNQWQYNNNAAWVNFTPVSSDRLLAAVDFSADTVTSLEGTSSNVSGINAGYGTGDIVITANMWNGSQNDGEFGVTGTFFEVIPLTTTNITPLNRGIAVTDNATGTGYIMFTAESVHTRFAGANTFNADHLIAVRLNGNQWQYNNNSAWVNFTAVSSDRLLAAVDFSADTVTSLEGTSSNVSGINAGYDTGDIVITANMWNGSQNNGEFGVTGTFFEVIPLTTINITPLNRGIAVTDNATGNGYIMFTAENVHTRFAGANTFNADYLIAVRLSGSQWQYNNNSAWVNFTPVSSDRLLAAVDFSADTVTSLEGTSSNVSGINAGYGTGDIVITANMWNGVSNAGEFGVTGTFFDTGCPANRPPEIVLVADLVTASAGGFVVGDSDPDSDLAKFNHQVWAANQLSEPTGFDRGLKNSITIAPIQNESKPEELILKGGLSLAMDELTQLDWNELVDAGSESFDEFLELQFETDYQVPSPSGRRCP